MSNTLPPHGHISRYKYHRCRCLPCMDAWRDYAANVRRQQAYGTWRPLVDADPIRAHVRGLQAEGVGIARIAHLAGVTHSTISRLLYSRGGKPPLKTMRRANAERILAIRPTLAAHADGSTVDATGTRRRIQALIAIGFTHKALAPHLGVHPMYVGNLVQQSTVTARHARSATRVYDLLWNADPAEHGVRPSSVARSRNLAARNGWPPPLAWDDDTIDDPAAVPDTGADQQRKGDTEAEIAWLLRSGETSIEVIAARVGIEEDSVRTAIGRARRRGAAWAVLAS